MTGTRTRRQAVIEVNDNVDLVTMRRRQDMQRAQESYQKAVAEGRLAVRPARTENAQLQVATSAPLPADASARRPYQAEPTSQAESTGATLPATDPEAAWRHTRLGITAGLVVLLLVVWIWQKRTGR